MKKIAYVFKSRKQVFTIAALWIMVVLFFSFTAPGYATTHNLFNLLRQTSITAIMAVGMMIVVCSGGIDLSIGSIVSVTTVVIAKLNVDGGVNIWVAMLIGILFGTLIGLINGSIIIFARVNPMISTLAMLTILSGLAYTITNSQPVYGLPESFKVIGQGYIGPVPIPIIIAAVVMIIGAFVMQKTYIGRYFYTVGSNAEAARLSGISVKGVRLIAHTLCGFFAGLGGAIMCSRLFSGQPGCGSAMEMDILTAIVVGGVSLAGGKGSMLGVVFGVLLMGSLTNGLAVMGVSSYNQMIAKGTVLILVVAVDGLRTVFTEKHKIRVIE